MTDKHITPTGRQVLFDEEEILVSKTDTKGRITYANDTFLRVAGYRMEELIGKPHNVIRHPEMPRAVFKLLWDTLLGGSEIFAYVVNLCKNGDHYWVHAHVTPTFNTQGEIVGFHSTRRFPDPAAIEKIKKLYATLLKEEKVAKDPRSGLQSSTALFDKVLSDSRMQYEEFIWKF